MARGKKSLLETSDLPIIETEKEEGQIPYFIIDEKYGVSCDERCEMLCRKKKLTRTIKNENGYSDHLETYFLWESFKYTNSFTSCIETYTTIKDRELKQSRLVKTKDYKELLKIKNEIKDILSNSLSKDGVNKEFLSITNVIDKQAKLKEELISLSELKEQLNKEYNSIMELIKEKRSIIIKNTEQKKHRIPKEE